jgi:hypothetical protein
MPGSFGWTQGEPPLYNFAVGLDTLDEILTSDLRLLTCLNHAALETVALTFKSAFSCFPIVLT